eukprot:258398_1
MDSDTTNTPNTNYLRPNLKRIHATDLHLCCGDQINSDFEDESFYIPFTTSSGLTQYYKTHYFTPGAGQCQLVSGAQSPILPVRITALCPEPEDCNHDPYLHPVNYPVRVFCAAPSSESVEEEDDEEKASEA